VYFRDKKVVGVFVRAPLQEKATGWWKEWLCLTSSARFFELHRMSLAFITLLLHAS
jgi:hypothetical protein